MGPVYLVARGATLQLAPRVATDPSQEEEALGPHPAFQVVQEALAKSV